MHNYFSINNTFKKIKIHFRFSFTVHFLKWITLCLKCGLSVVKTISELICGWNANYSSVVVGCRLSTPRLIHKPSLSLSPPIKFGWAPEVSKINVPHMSMWVLTETWRRTNRLSHYHRYIIKIIIWCYADSTDPAPSQILRSLRDTLCSRRVPLTASTFSALYSYFPKIRMFWSAFPGAVILLGLFHGYHSQICNVTVP